MTRPPLVRPTLLPGLRRLWRDRHTLQLGVDPARALVIELADPATAYLLDLLDGARPEPAVIAAAVAAGIDPADAAALLDALRRAGLVVGAHTLLPASLPEPARLRLAGEAAALALHPVIHRVVRGDVRGAPVRSPAQILRRRAAAVVVVTGRGRLGPPVAMALAHAGVGHVTPDLIGPVDAGDTLVGGLHPADLGRPRAAAVAAAIGRHVPGTQTTHPVRAEQVSLVVDAGAPGPAALRAAGYARHGHPHLALAVQEGTAVIGPLVPVAGAPCLNCLDLHRRDRDPAWPALAAQLAIGVPGPDHVDLGTPASGHRQPADDGDPCSAPTLLAAAGFAAAEVLSHLDGRVPSTLGATVEIDPAGRHRRRSWSPHPLCDCRNLRREPGRRRESVTMIR